MNVWMCIILSVGVGCLSGKTLLFLNGDRLNGSPVGVSEGAMVWDAEVFSDSLSASLAQLDKVLLSEGDVKAGNSTDSSVTVLMNRGDILQGSLKGGDERSFLLETAWSEGLRIQKSMIKSVEFNEGARYFLTGDTNVVEWDEVSNRKKWLDTSQGIGVRGRGAMSKEVEFSSAFKTSFKIKMKESPRFRMLLLASEGKVYEPESYLEVVIQRRNIMARVRNLGDIETVGQINSLEDLEDVDIADFDFYVDLKKQLMSIYMNGNSVSQWSLPKGMTVGDWMYIYSEYEGEVVLEELSIAEWNGALPVTQEKKADFTAGGHKPLILLENGDLLEATLSQVSMEEVLAKTELGDITVKSDKISLIDFSRVSYDEARREAKDVIVYLLDGSKITLVLEEWNETHFKGYSQQFGSISVSLKEVHSVDFNIYIDSEE